jgi:hypothetical protein
MMTSIGAPATQPAKESFWLAGQGAEVILLVAGMVLTLVVVAVFVFIFIRASKDSGE